MAHVWRRRVRTTDTSEDHHEKDASKMTSYRLLMRWLVSVYRITKKRIIHGRCRGYTSLIFLVVLLLFYLLYHLVYVIGIWYGNPSVDRWCERTEIPSYLLRREPDEITLVTAYFNLGVLKTGSRFWDYTAPYKYKQWMRPLGRIANPLIVYVEDDDMVKYLREIRSCFPANNTIVIKLHRSELWSFSIMDNVTKIYSNSSYPKFYPNTVSAEYTCVKHSKYELLKTTIEADLCKTPALAWIDSGYFKHLDGSDVEPFKLLVPSKFNPEKIGFTQIMPRDPYLTPTTVMTKNALWVSTGFILGVPDILKTFMDQYMSSVKEFLKTGLMNSDEQVIYAMYTVNQPFTRFAKVVKGYTCNQGQLGLYGSDTQFYCLGYVCKHIWERITP